MFECRYPETVSGHETLSPAMHCAAVSSNAHALTALNFMFSTVPQHPGHEKES
jgi:hypothetical protein